MAITPTFSQLSSAMEEESGSRGKNYKEDFQIVFAWSINLSGQDVIDKDYIDEEDSQGSCTNQSILLSYMDAIDDNKETEYEFLPTPTLTFLTICECSIPTRVVYNQSREVDKVLQHY